MKLFIFENVGKLTANHHEGGALVIIAQSLERALEMAKNHENGYSWQENKKSIQLSEAEIKDVRSFELAETAKEEIFIFADAGCC